MIHDVIRGPVGILAGNPIFSSQRTAEIAALDFPCAVGENRR